MSQRAKGLLAQAATIAPRPLAHFLTWVAGANNRVVPDTAAAGAGAAAPAQPEGAAAAATAGPGAAQAAAAGTAAGAAGPGAGGMSMAGGRKGLGGAASSTGPGPEGAEGAEADASVAVGYGGKLAPKARAPEPPTPRGRRAQAQLQVRGASLRPRIIMQIALQPEYQWSPSHCSLLAGGCLSGALTAAAPGGTKMDDARLPSRHAMCTVVQSHRTKWRTSGRLAVLS
jgi:hypothetical protein